MSATAFEEGVLWYNLIGFGHEEIAVMPVDVTAEILSRVARVHAAEGHAFKETLDTVTLQHLLVDLLVLQFESNLRPIVRCTVREEALVFTNDDT